MINNKSIAVLGCKHTTLELVEGLHKSGITIDSIITISPEKGSQQNVAGYLDLTEYATHNNIKLIVTPKYNLKESVCREIILNENIDILLVMGWQRLIPTWMLDSLTIGAFGMHGSNRPLPHGRGRSPLNWSLIQNKNIFFTHLFQYLPEVDNGPIVDVQKFQINEFDTCLSLHYKNTLSMIKLCSKNLELLSKGNMILTTQSEENLSYYPKRSAEDGLIFWQDSTRDIYNLMRAVSKPFPGAFTYLNGDKTQKITIWKGIPFDQILSWNNSSFGEILEVFENGDFIVKTGDGTFLVTDYEGPRIGREHLSEILMTDGEPRKTWTNLPI